MNSKVITVLLHIGGLIKTFRDLEKAIEDSAKGNFQGPEWLAVLDDLAQLVEDGVINIPGLTQDQLTQVVADIKKASA